ncbi:MAG TPA: DUF2505 family protein [Polyangiaceae bacterium]|nr:DUF2505 family protein [Polyangiaceae bacterium]
MSEKVRIEHVIECSEEKFWELFLDEKYNQALFQGYLKFPLWKVASVVDGEKEMKRVVEVEPYVADLPTAIKKVIGDNIRYKEDGVLDKEKRRYNVTVVPVRLADKLFVRGVQTTEPAPGGFTKRIFTADIDVKIFGVGGLIEKRVAADLTRSYDLGAKFTNRYIKENGIA